MINKILFSLIISCIAFFFPSCSVIVCHLIPESKKVDISNHPRMQHLVGHCLELKQHAFLYQYADTKTYALNVPGRVPHLPASINDYLRDPLNWQNTDLNAKIGKGAADGYLKIKVIAVIPKGTKLYVSQVLEKQTGYDSLLFVIAYLDDPQYSDLPVNVYFLLKPKFGRILIPYPEEPELTAMGKEITPYLNPEYLDYCD